MILYPWGLSPAENRQQMAAGAEDQFRRLVQKTGAEDRRRRPVQKAVKR
ncbi:MAG: hypothetical protein II627_05470 [Lachnospiraceae bacterium]|nr:hypothetical protein [Lachnospiraceae bacterium]